jgi:chromosome segregation ATPase
MPSQKLKPLKLRIVEAQKELDVILETTKAKQPFLDAILGKIKVAEKKLDDNFSHKELELQKVHLKRAEELELAGDKIAVHLNELADRQQIAIEKTVELEQKLRDLKVYIINSERILRNNTQETARLKADSLRLRAEITTTNNFLNDLKSQKKTLEDEISAKVAENNSVVYDMQTTFSEQKNHLDFQIEDAKTELRELQQSIQLYTNKKVELDEEYKQKNIDLVQRENALIIKTRALAKDRAEFETETRRWNYVKPLPI